MIVLDQTIVNVALPSIQSDLDFSQSSLAWVVNAYLIPFGGLLLLAGRVGDLIGQKRVFMSGLALFVAASLLCALAQTSEMLIGARFLQGAGGALTSAVILGMIVTMFPQPGDQAKAIGVYSFVASAGASIGLLLGGVLTEAINWHWIFFVNVPIGLVTAILASRLLKNDEGIGLGRGADVLGAVLITTSLMLAVYTLVEASNYGWVSAHTLGFGTGAIALLAAFIRRESRTANPLIPLRIFRSRNVSGANVIQALMVAGLFGMFFIGALWMQQALGYGALEVGLAFLPVALAIGILSLGFSARLITRFGARSTLIPGLALIVGGLLLFAQTPVDADYVSDMLPSMLALGIGAGLSFPSLMTLSMSGATKTRLRPGLGPGQHHPSGRRRPGPRRAGDTLDHPHRGSRSRRAVPRRGADQRPAPGAGRRRRPARGCPGAGADRAPARVGGREAGRGGRAGRAPGRARLLRGRLSAAGVSPTRRRPKRPAETSAMCSRHASETSFIRGAG